MVRCVSKSSKARTNRPLADFGMSRTIELVPGGTDIAVTNENRIKYIYLTSNYRLNAQMAPQCGAFFSGLSEIIPERFLRMFNQAELRMLVGESLFTHLVVRTSLTWCNLGGVDQPIDLRDLRDNTVYGGWDGDEANDTIRDFWDVVEGFDKDERSRLVKFVTSCARPPLLGFSELNPRFAIRAAGADQTRLPTR
jgi:ubiquitin-protein ligase E3 C